MNFQSPTSHLSISPLPSPKGWGGGDKSLKKMFGLRVHNRRTSFCGSWASFPLSVLHTVACVAFSRALQTLMAATGSEHPARRSLQEDGGVCPVTMPPLQASRFYSTEGGQRKEYGVLLRTPPPHEDRVLYHQPCSTECQHLPNLNEKAASDSYPFPSSLLHLHRSSSGHA